MRAFFSSIRARVAASWLALEAWQRTHAVVLSLSLVGFLAHYVILFCWIQPWYIEDSAISFAYARNFIQGDGLVPFVGSERVEGYSNPLWTLLIALGWGIGITPWTSAKVLGAVFGCAAMLFAYGITRYARDQRDGDWIPLLTPWMLAASTQFVLWAASGLENGLFYAMLAGGIWALARESTEGRRFPLSALFFLLLAVTRPDGVAYAGVALFARLCASVVRGQWLALLYWILAFGAPFAAYHAVRYDYFAWPWPNTWYAKEKEFKPFNWGGTGWKQWREYSVQYGIAFAAPLLVFGVSSFRGWRRWAAIALLALAALFVLWDGRDGIPSSWRHDALTWVSRHWVEARVWTLLGSSILLGLLTLGSRGWEARSLAWASYATGVFFSIVAGGDWMRGYRWFSLTTVPQFVLIAVGIGEFIDALPAVQRTLFGRLPMRLVYGLVPTLALMAANIPGSNDAVVRPETSPRDVHKRVNYMSWVQRRLEIERVRLLDVDMGAHTWYTDWEIADIAGLIDLPMARHKYEKPFMAEYIFDEWRPDFAHVHGSWANKSKIPRIDRWKEEYIEIPGFPTGGKAFHVGNHVRKDLIARTTSPREGVAPIAFGGGVTLADWQTPSPEVAAGGELWVASSWQGGGRADGFRTLVFLARDGALAWVAETVPGYDWYDNEYWTQWDYVDGRWSLPLPDTLAEGEYRVGVVVLDEITGAVLPWEGAAADAVYMVGEWIAPDTVRVVSPAAAREAADRAYARGIDAAKSGECLEAAARWRDAVHHVATDATWRSEREGEMKRARVDCLVDRAEATPDLVARAEIYREARLIQPRHERLVASGQQAGMQLVPLGDRARDAEDWETAYRSYRAAVWSDPTLSWARKEAEAARDKRLGIGKKEEKGKRK